MGLTIHYNLHSSTRSRQKVRELVAQLRGRAADLPFERVREIIDLSGPECNYESLDMNDRNHWLLIQAGRYINERGPDGLDFSYRVQPLQVIAFSTLPGEGCEEANFGLCRFPAMIEVNDPRHPRRKKPVVTGLGTGWYWGAFCKTQYASDPAYGGVAHFLRCHLSVIRMLHYARELGILDSVFDEGELWERHDVAALAQRAGGWDATIARQVGRYWSLMDDDVRAAIAALTDVEELAAQGSGLSAVSEGGSDV